MTFAWENRTIGCPKISVGNGALGGGPGSEARRPLGIAIVGGLVFSQILTLYLTPVFYTYMEEWRKKAGKPRLLNGVKVFSE